MSIKTTNVACIWRCLWRPPVHISCRTTSCGRNDMCPIGLSSVLKTRMSNIKFQYGVFVSFSYSCLYFNNLLTCFQVQLLLFMGHHSIHFVSQFFIFRVFRSLCSPYDVNHLNL
jgi:hypothetical protein